MTGVLSVDQISGAEGDAVRALGQELGVRVRFKAVLPIGRGAALDLAPAFYSSLNDSAEALAASAGPVATCGLGMNLYIGPRGECYPCYAVMSAHHGLGNALEEGMKVVLNRNNAYRRVTVDSNSQCHACALRNLCGGFCRAWVSANDPDAPSTSCRSLHARAHDLLLGSLEVLDVSVQRWQSAGLPLPDEPPEVV